MRYFFLAVVIFIFTSGMASAGDPICFLGEPLEDSHRAYTFLNSLQADIMSQKPVKVCAWEDSEKNSSYIAVTFFKNVWVIMATSYTLTEFSDEALMGALAHELGHILINSDKNLQNEIKRKQEDRKADAIAIKLAGREALLATYIAHTRNKNLAKRRVDWASRLISSKEIDKYLY